MKLIDTFHRRARVRTRTEDTGSYHILSTDDLPGNLQNNPLIDYPVYFTAKVQVRVLGIWVTIWAATCDIMEETTVDAIINRANEIADTVSCTGL